MEKDQKIRAAIYCRVSTIDKKQDTNLQLTPLHDYCTARKWDIAGEYIDKGISGSKDQRPALDRLMNDAKKLKINCIIVWKLDRWGRSLKHLINSLSELQNLGVSFISYQENIDFSTPAGKMMFHIIGAMAEFERELIRERVRAGIQNAQKKGIKVGRRALSEITHNDVMELRSKGHSIRNIAKKLHLSVGSVHKTLSKAASQNGLNT